MTTITLKLDDSRRLTGKNYFCDQPGAVLDAFVSGVDKQYVVDVWLEQLAYLLDKVGWADAQRFYRIFEDGISLGFTAPMDALYAATEINEAAWERMNDLVLRDMRWEGLEGLAEKLSQMIHEEQNPKLSALISAAETQGVVYLADDDAFSLGYGISAEVWDITALPDPDTLDWSKYQSLPIALVTGTNGKSTSVRLTAQIIKQAGLRCGVTSTDFIRVGDTLLDTGDYSGPGGARMLLRYPETEAAVLEVARGGLLRRGLPIPQVDAALVTNVAEDHLGQYGINSVAALTAAKMMVAKAVTKELVLNADDVNLVGFVENSSPPFPPCGGKGRGWGGETNQITPGNEQYAPPSPPSPALPPQGGKGAKTFVSTIPQEPLADSLPQNITWFSLNENNPVITNARANQQKVCFVRDGEIVYASPEAETNIIAVNAIPMTLQGAAVHNVQNALGAVALSKALGIDDSAISSALAQFKSDAADNPGRGNLFDYQGASVMLDFAHNVHSMDAMATTLHNMPATRKILLLCHAGDRSDSEIEALTLSAMAMQPDLVWICELPDYLRGRELGTMPEVIAASVRKTGLAESAMFFADSPLQGAEAIVKQLQSGDLVFIMALSQRDEIAALVTDQDG